MIRSFPTTAVTPCSSGRGTEELTSCLGCAADSARRTTFFRVLLTPMPASRRDASLASRVPWITSSSTWPDSARWACRCLTMLFSSTLIRFCAYPTMPESSKGCRIQRVHASRRPVGMG